MRFLEPKPRATSKMLKTKQINCQYFKVSQRLTHGRRCFFGKEIVLCPCLNIILDTCEVIDRTRRIHGNLIIKNELASPSQTHDSVPLLPLCRHDNSLPPILGLDDTNDWIC